jgi:uncharacterized protein YjiS (DUF1127 family)
MERNEGTNMPVKSTSLALGPVSRFMPRDAAAVATAKAKSTRSATHDAVTYSKRGVAQRVAPIVDDVMPRIRHRAAHAGLRRALASWGARATRLVTNDAFQNGPLRSQAFDRDVRRPHAGRTIGAAIVSAARVLLAWARYVKVRHEQWREARATYESLRHLDDRALRDLGFDRLEISSVAAEVSGRAERTRSLALDTI